MSPLFANAVDSLRTGMTFFRDRNSKYAILLVFHSIELLLKELLSRQHPVLIYRNIDKPVTEESQTVGFGQMFTRFDNVGIPLTKSEKETLKALQIRRNRIEHHRYDPDKDDHDTLGQSLKFIMSFFIKHLDDDLRKHIDKELLEEIEAIVLTYEERLSLANHEFEQWANKNYEGGFESVDFVGTVDCPLCSQTLLVIEEPSIGTYCFFCRSEVVAEECKHCGRTFMAWDGSNSACIDCLSYEE